MIHDGFSIWKYLLSLRSCDALESFVLQRSHCLYLHLPLYFYLLSILGKYLRIHEQRMYDMKTKLSYSDSAFAKFLMLWIGFTLQAIDDPSILIS